MKTFTALAGSGLLLWGTGAFAQEISHDTHGPDDTAAPAAEAPMEAADPMATPGEAETTLPADTAATPDTAMPAEGAVMSEPAPAPAATESVFTDAEVASFAAAAIEIQALEGEEAVRSAQAADIVAQSGIDAATFNAIGEAMTSDPALAERVQVAAAGLQAEPEG